MLMPRECRIIATFADWCRDGWQRRCGLCKTAGRAEFGAGGSHMRSTVFRRISLAATVIASFGFAEPSIAMQASEDWRQPEILARLVACRGVPEAAARLSCYDDATADLSTAAERGDVVVIDRDQAAVAGRQLFGFDVPSLGTLFAQRAGDVPIDAIETTLVGARRPEGTRWVFDLADGSRWGQIDSAPVRFQNRQGRPVRVRRAALGSYLLVVDGSRAVRVRRQ